MDLMRQGAVVAELSKLAEELDAVVGALVQATQRGLEVSNLRPVVLDLAADLVAAVPAE